MLKFWNLELLERKFKSWFLYGVSNYILMLEFWNLELLERKFKSWFSYGVSNYILMHIQILERRSFEKRAIFDLLFTFFSHQGKVTKIPSAHISLTCIHVFCSPYWLFLPYQFWKKYEFIRYGFSLVWVLVLILIRAILEQSINNKMVSKI